MVWSTDEPFPLTNASGNRGSMGMALFPLPRSLKFLDTRGLLKYLLDLFVIAGIYFALAKLDLALVAIHPNAIPIAPTFGFALAAILLRGLRVWPAVFTAALAAHVPTVVSDMGSANAILPVAIATGDTLAAIIGSYLISLWSGGRGTFDTPAHVAKFATVGLGPAAMLGATVNAGAVCLILSSCSNLLSDWVTHWLRDASGILVIAPAVVLWSIEDRRAFDYDNAWLGKKMGSFCGGGFRGCRVWLHWLQPAARIAREQNGAQSACSIPAVVGCATLQPTRYRSLHTRFVDFCRMGRLAKHRSVGEHCARVVSGRKRDPDQRFCARSRPERRRIAAATHQSEVGPSGR
jgi:hypothetical protein